MSEINTSNASPKGSDSGFLILIIITAVVVLSIFSAFGGCGKAGEKSNKPAATEHATH